MFGFVNIHKKNPKRQLGCDAVRNKKKKLNIVLIILGIVAFGILNLVLYSLTSI